MNNLHPTVEKWFTVWETGNIEDLPVTEDFSHTSPFGTIKPKKRYLEVVEKNRDDFLGCKFSILEQVKEGNNICVRYEMKNENTKLEMSVCEWYILEGDLIKEIFSFYNIGDAVIKG